MNKIAQWYANFMRGRNGSDAYGRFLLITGLFINLAGVLLGKLFLMVLSDVIFFYELFRILSKNLVKRRIENDSFVTIVNWGKHILKARKLEKNDPERKYLVCPNCHRIVRVPKGHGKIDVTCPTCQKVFSAKS